MSILYLKITDNCNLKCPFCYIKQNSSFLDPKLAIEKILDIKPNKVIFHGGEPLLYSKNILQILDYFNNSKIDFSITTNFVKKLDNIDKLILDKCNSIATSYSIDRFNENKNAYNNFVENCKNYKFTLLITLSEAQLKQTPIELNSIITELQPDNITFERLFDINKNENFYINTDNYLNEIFKLIPYSKNNLYKNMLFAYKNNTTVFPLNCKSEVFTINTDGSICSCPNLYNTTINITKKIKCLNCELYMYCRGDCSSFKNICCFPKKTFLNIINGV